jgi:FimV-like protein
MGKILTGIVCGFCVIVSTAVVAMTTYGPTIPNDTLWSIATKLKPSNEVSVQQAMLAILCCNEQAFYRDNINALEPGKIIDLPSVEVMNSFTKDQAYFEVARQNRQWKKINRKHYKKAERKAPRLKKEISVDLKESKQQLEVLTPELEEVSSPEIPQPELTTISSQIVAPSAQGELFIDDVNNRLTVVESQNNIIQSQIGLLGERISAIEQNVEQLKQENLENKKNFSSRLIVLFEPIQQQMDKLSAVLGQTLFAILSICIVALFLLIVVYLIIRCRRCSAGSCSHKIESDKEEYSITQNKEGVAAKLNLARAYIDMGNEAEAQETLQEVLKDGSEAEKLEAKELLEKMKPISN